MLGDDGLGAAFVEVGDDGVTATDAVRALSCWRSAYLVVLRGVCESKTRLFLALRPPKLSRSSTEHMTEMTR